MLGDDPETVGTRGKKGDKKDYGTGHKKEGEHVQNEACKRPKRASDKTFDGSGSSFGSDQQWEP